MNENNVIENNNEELEATVAVEEQATENAPAADEAVAESAADAVAEDVAETADNGAEDELSGINAEAEEQKAKSKEAELAALQGFNWKKLWDKVTTGLLIFLLSSPFLVLIYIVLWFTILR